MGVGHESNYLQVICEFLANYLQGEELKKIPDQSGQESFVARFRVGERISHCKYSV